MPDSVESNIIKSYRGKRNRGETFQGGRRGGSEAQIQGLVTASTRDISVSSTGRRSSVRGRNSCLKGGHGEETKEEKRMIVATKT